MRVRAGINRVVPESRTIEFELGDDYYPDEYGMRDAAYDYAFDKLSWMDVDVEFVEVVNDGD